MDKLITIVGLGPGDPGMLSLQVWEQLNSEMPVYVRTAIHPTVEWLGQKGIKFMTMDHHYREADTFESVYRRIAEEVVKAAHMGPLVYAVPGHPMVAEESVRLILTMAAREGLETRVLPAMSFLDALSAALKLDPCQGLHIIDALRLDVQAPDPRVGTVLTQVYDRITAGEAKLALMDYYPDEHEVTVVRAAGVPEEERIERVPLYQMDRLNWIDHLTSIYIDPLTEGVDNNKETPEGEDEGAGVDTVYNCSFPLDPLVEVMGALRAENGCPWDREQTHETLKQYLIEEAYEVIDALDEGQMYKICEELGDLLLQIIFHAQIARENKQFDMNDVVQAITEKMLRRHPHVFGATKVKNSQEVLINWDKIKAQEQGASPGKKSFLANIPRGLPALLRAEKVQVKAARVGFDWPSYHGAVDKIKEELNEVLQALEEAQASAVAEELGDLLFAVVNLARLLGVEAEGALTRTTNKFMKRFNYIEQQAIMAGQNLPDLTLEQMDKWWEEAKSTS